MHSRAEARRRSTAPFASKALRVLAALRVSAARLVSAALLVSIALSWAPHARAQDFDLDSELPVADGERPSREQTEEAIDAVRAELFSTRTIRTLKWNGPRASEDDAVPGGLQWLVDLFRFVGQSGRALVWVGAIVLFALIAYHAVRLLRTARFARPPPSAARVTHVRDLDIRPESLPDDVGAAARALWDSGERRAALALLYRGLLSRLVHVHAVPIRDSTTEGDALALAEPLLAEPARAYAVRLVRTWQRAVYGDDEPSPELVRALCDEFGSRLGAPAPQPAASTSGGEP